METQENTIVGCFTFWLLVVSPPAQVINNEYMFHPYTTSIGNRRLVILLRGTALWTARFVTTSQLGNSDVIETAFGGRV
jgi:hypothetical protein